MSRWFLCLLAVGFAGLSGAAGADQTRAAGNAPVASRQTVAAEHLSEFDGALRQAQTTGDFVGLAVAVVRDGNVTFMRTYGETLAGSGDAVTPDTVFRIASLSKGFASSLTGLAVAEGKLSLDAPAIRYAPDLALPGGAEKSLTLAHLLSHRTGLPPNAYDNLLEAGIAPDAILPQYRKVKPICPAAACYAYQNITYDIAGRALSGVYGQPFADLVEARLFEPLGMATASLGQTGLVESGSWARPHTRKQQKVPGLPQHPWTEIEVKLPYYATPAAGGVNASIRDMAKWLNAQLGNAPDVLPPAVLDLVHTPQVSTPSETRRMRGALPELAASHYALGWRVYDYAGHRIIAHGGSVDGYGAHILFIPEKQTGIVVLSNTRTRRLWNIGPMFLDLTLGQPQRDWLALDPEVTPPQ